MISFDEAKKIINEYSIILSTEIIPCDQSLFRIAGDDLYAPIDLPPFDNSAVDGFALHGREPFDIAGFKVLGAIYAGKSEEIILPAYHAKKIMTGAPIPKGADRVVMKEDAEYKNDLVTIKKPVNKNDHIRFRGKDIAKNDLAVKKGMKISARTIGLMRALGYKDIPVVKPPSVAIISSGNELVAPGQKLKFGEVYYLSGPMIEAMCHELGVTNITTTLVSDDLLSMTNAIEKALPADILVLIGGMSLGDYDLARPALKLCGVEEIFHRGAWRPGKPFYMGKINDTVVFGLPGNPNAAFVCFHVFVRPLIKKALDHSFLEILPRATLTKDFLKRPEFTIFALAELVSDKQQLHPMSSQGSHQINSLNKASALALMPAREGIVKAGSLVHYYPLSCAEHH